MVMEIELIVNGKKIPLNRYVQTVFCNVISALISTLKGVDEEWESVEIRIRK